MESPSSKLCYTFQYWKATGSTTVGCNTIFPVNTPQVTAFEAKRSAFEKFS